MTSKIPKKKFFNFLDEYFGPLKFSIFGVVRAIFSFFFVSVFLFVVILFGSYERRRRHNWI